MSSPLTLGWRVLDANYGEIKKKTRWWMSWWRQVIRNLRNYQVNKCWGVTSELKTLIIDDRWESEGGEMKTEKTRSCCSSETSWLISWSQIEEEDWDFETEGKPRDYVTYFVTRLHHHRAGLCSSLQVAHFGSKLPGNVTMATRLNFNKSEESPQRCWCMMNMRQNVFVLMCCDKLFYYYLFFSLFSPVFCMLATKCI